MREVDMSGRSAVGTVVVLVDVGRGDGRGLLRGGVVSVLRGRGQWRRN